MSERDKSEKTDLEKIIELAVAGGQVAVRSYTKTSTAGKSFTVSQAARGAPGPKNGITNPGGALRSSSAPARQANTANKSLANAMGSTNPVTVGQTGPGRIAMAPYSAAPKSAPATSNSALNAESKAAAAGAAVQSKAVANQLSIQGKAIAAHAAVQKAKIAAQAAVAKAQASAQTAASKASAAKTTAASKAASAQTTAASKAAAAATKASAAASKTGATSTAAKATPGATSAAAKAAPTAASTAAKSATPATAAAKPAASTTATKPPAAAAKPPVAAKPPAAKPPVAAKPPAAKPPTAPKSSSGALSKLGNVAQVAQLLHGGGGLHMLGGGNGGGRVYRAARVASMLKGKGSGSKSSSSSSSKGAPSSGARLAEELAAIKDAAAYRHDHLLGKHHTPLDFHAKLTSSEIVELQLALSAKGYPVSIDGKLSAELVVLAKAYLKAAE